MAICRIEKVSNYTVMSNYHLKDTNLSLRAAGLLSKMLSLPDEWDYTIKGLTSICKEGRDCISSAVKELEEFHYIKREREHLANGRLGGMIYTIYEIPYDVNAAEVRKPKLVEKSTSSPGTGFPAQVKPAQVEPTQVKPVQDFPTQEKPTQSNTNRSITKEAITNTPSTNQSINTDKTNKSNNNYNNESTSNATSDDRLIEMKSQINYKAFEAENDFLLEQLENDTLSLDEFNSRCNHIKLINLMLSDLCEIYASSDEEVNIGKRTVARKAFLAKFEKLNHADIKKITDLVYANNPKNRKLYTLAVIFNY